MAYHISGPNSNTFSHVTANFAGLRVTMPPNVNVPGWSYAP